jgi:thermostable 8-oxoguanine DNA glycosylase
MADYTNLMPADHVYGMPGPAIDSIANAQWWLMYAILVSNKSAQLATTKLNAFLAKSQFGRPFAYIKKLSFSDDLRKELEAAKVGQYNRVHSAYLDIAEKLSPLATDDPRTWRLVDLESIPGVGPKTARWYYGLIHPNAKVAALDTHVLKFLRDQGHEAPKATPPAGSRYLALEEIFLKHAADLEMPAPQLDYLIWQVYRKGGMVLVNSDSVYDF